MRDDSEHFVGQVLGRKSPVVDFRAAARLEASLEHLGTPIGSEARPRVEVEEAAQLVARAERMAEERRDPLESEVRLSVKPTSRLPVLPSVQRHTRMDLASIAPVRATWRFAQGAARLGLAIATGLALLTGVTIAARAAMPGPTLFAAYLAETPTVKGLRAEMHVSAPSATDTLLPAGDEAAAADVSAVAAHPHAGAKAHKHESSHAQHHASSATDSAKAKSAKHHAKGKHGAHTPAK